MYLDVEIYYQPRETRHGDCNDAIGALAPIRNIGSNYYGKNAKTIREKITHHFMNEGELSFQYEKI